MSGKKEKEIISILKKKSKLKQKVFENVYKTFNELKEVLRDIEISYNEQLKGVFEDKIIRYKDVSRYQAELKIAGDILIFSMHSNVFQFDKEHDIWKIPYVKKNKMTTYSGVINIYNFLADSFKYDRIEDLGYLVGRIFVNKDFHYFVEGKRQMGLIHNNFGRDIMDKKAMKEIIETSISYSLGFDLLVPKYDDAMIVSVEHIKEKRKNIRTAKRLGFGFRTDDVHGKKLLYTGG